MTHSEAGKLGYEKSRAKLDKYHALLLKIRNEYEANPKLCQHCRKEIGFYSRGNTFCSRSCRATHTQRGKLRKIRDTKCLQCGSPLVRRGSKFCSLKCMGNNVREKSKRRLETGEFSKNSFTSSTLRRILIEIRGYQCEICKNSIWNNKKIPLSVHHIDGDACNNKLENLQILCLNCHGQTDNFGSKNKKCTRLYRKKYYTAISERRDVGQSSDFRKIEHETESDVSHGSILTPM